MTCIRLNTLIERTEHYKQTSEQIGSSDNASDLCSRGALFESRPGLPLSWQVFCDTDGVVNNLQVNV
jgi:hypothetical protein